MKLQTVTRSSENESSNDRTKKMKNENFHKGLNEDLSEDSNESSNEVFTERSSQESNDDLNDSLHEHNEEQIKNSEQRPSILVMNPLVKLHQTKYREEYDHSSKKQNKTCACYTTNSQHVQLDNSHLRVNMDVTFEQLHSILN
ncbi:unnamed protein product [Rotaria magnacalcarata]|uniref:Uncharacterized protein n=1 Tax=Rotaria magnacalcarata TaxID=392030 RepID=A0A8S2R1S8_9BILA|nr:unnamed protein product [Rotaria magnacalcarata]